MTRPTFDDYVATRSRVLLRFAYVLCGDRHLAEDLVQEVLIKAHRRWAAIETQNPEAYVKQALVRTHLSWARRRASSEVPTDRFPDVPVTRHFDDGHASRDELWAMLARLPRTQRAVLVLRYFEDLDDTRIAELVGVSSSTVRVHAHRGLQALRATLQARADEAPTSPGMLASVKRGVARAARRRRTATAAGIATIVVVMLLVALPFVWAGNRHPQPIVPPPSLTPTPSSAPSGSPSSVPAASGTGPSSGAAAARPWISDLAGHADGLRVTMTFTVHPANGTGPFTCTLTPPGTDPFPCTAGANTQIYDLGFSGQFELHASVIDNNGVHSDQANAIVDVPPIDPPSVTTFFTDLDGGQWYIHFLVDAATGDHPECAVDSYQMGGPTTHLDRQSCAGGMRFPVSGTGNHHVTVLVYSSDWKVQPQMFERTVTVG